MLDLARNGYTEQEVINQLHGKNGSRGLVKIRYDLLNRQDVKLGELMVQSGRVAMDSLAEIKRTASFELTEQEAQDVDWLNDRIRPVFCLKMPEIRKTGKAWGKIDASLSRSSIAYLSNGRQVPANTPRFEQGQFGQAVLVEEGTENLQPDPDFADGMTGKSSYNWGGGGVVTASDGICTIDNADSASLLALIVPQVAITADTGAHTVSVKCRSANGEDAVVQVWMGVSYKSLGVAPASGEWVVLSATYNDGEYTTNPAQHTRIGPGRKIQLDWIQVEKKPYPTSFTDGTRAAESLTIPTEGVLNPQEGTIECWVYVNDLIKDTSSYRYIFAHDTTGGGNNAIALRHRNYWGFWTSNPNGDSSMAEVVDDLDTGWHHFAVRWTTDESAIFVDGYKAAAVENPYLPDSISSDLCIGCWTTGGYGWANTLIDDFRISNCARTDEEILAEYQRNKPHLIDQWTTAKFSFDDKLSGDYFTLVDRDISAQWIEWPLGVFILSSPTRRDENGQVKRSIEAYDASLILKEDKFTDRYIVAAGTKYTDAIIDILNSAGIWKINIIDHPGTLATDREFEIGTEKLYAVNELLAAINYTSLWVDENGYFVAQPYILPSNRDPEYEYRTDDLSIIHPGGTEELDLFGVPNKWVRYVSNPDRAVILRSEYVNDLSTSPTSTVNRGRTIVDIDSVEDIYDQATLDEYVKRIAYNASQVYGKFEFTTALMPHHSYYNCLFAEYDPLGISHKYMESSWTMDLQPGGVMRHSCRRVIQI